MSFRDAPLRGAGIIVTSGLSFGANARFLRALMTPVPPYTIDWTPGIYGLAGFLCSAVALQVVLKDQAILSDAARRVMISLHGLLFAGWLAFAAYVFARALRPIL